MNSFKIDHVVFDFKNDKRQFHEKVGGTLRQVKFTYYKGCERRLIEVYVHAVESYCSAKYPESMIVVYPGTKVRINGEDRVAGLYGSTIFLPGFIYKGCPNKACYREVVARANALLCLSSLPRILNGLDWSTEKTVVSVAKDIYGDEIGDEIKMHFEFIGI